ncbi:MAG TPA: thioredoxin family protein [Alphaproteobacteria bacterium]|nr:thioredoxin family protein [Alphaproteobacteria bacterium]
MKLSRRQTILGTGAAAAALTLAFLLPVEPGEAVPRIGQKAPDFAATDSYGNTVHLSDFKGKTVVLEWTNHQCPFVRKHYSTGNMQAHQKAATSEGVVWLSIISSAPGKQGYVTAEQANELTREREAAPTRVLLDPKGTIGHLYDARTTPDMYVIDAKGTLRYMGAIDDTPTANPDDLKTAQSYVTPAITAVLSGGKVDPAVTRPYGCSVKYGS